MPDLSLLTGQLATQQIAERIPAPRRSRAFPGPRSAPGGRHALGPAAARMADRLDG